MEAAQAFFHKAVAANDFSWPSTVNLDGYAASHRALRMLGEANPKWKSVNVRCFRAKAVVGYRCFPPAS